jgi:hypothetical protein
LHLLVRQNVFVINVPLIRKTLIDKVGLLDESLQTVEDWNYWLRCALAGACFVFDGEATSRAMVRLHPHSHSTNQQRMLSDSIQVRQQLATELARCAQLPGREVLLQENQEALQALCIRLDGLRNSPPPVAAPSGRRALGWLRNMLRAR